MASRGGGGRATVASQGANPASAASAAAAGAGAAADVRELVAQELARREATRQALAAKIPRTLKRPRRNPRAARSTGFKRLRTNRFAEVNLAGCTVQDGHMGHMLKQLRGNTVLRTLSVADNWLTDPAVKRMVRFLIKTGIHGQLHELSLSYNEFGDDAVFAIADMLELDTCRIQVLRLAGNKYTTRGVQRLAQAVTNRHKVLRRLQLHNYEWPCLEVCHEVQSELLSLAGVDLRRRDVVFLAELIDLGLSNELTERVEVLDISRNSLTAPQVVMAALYAGKLHSLTSLDLSGNHITRDATRQLVQILRRPGSFDALTSLTLGELPLPVQQMLGYSTATAVRVAPESENSRSRIHHADVMFTTNALLENPMVTDLSLQHTDIGNNGSRVLAELAGHNTTLTSLCMSNVGVTPYGATAVAWALHRTLSLHTLDLSRNPLGKQGMHNLCEGLRGNHTVTSLDVSQSAVYDEGVRTLAGLMSQRRMLTHLNVSNCKLSDVSAERLAAAMFNKSPLCALLMRQNSIGETGALMLAKAVRRQGMLHTLALGKNYVGKAGAFSFAKLLRSCTCLKRLDLSDNQIDEVGCGAMVAMLTRNRFVENLDLTQNHMLDKDERTLTNTLTANKFFHGEFDKNNRLIGGVRWFPNGDRLIVGPRSLRGFLARGTYQMARPLSPLQTAEVLLILLLNMSVWILIPFVYLHLKGEGWEFFAYPLFAAAAYCIVFREAQLMWSSDRRLAALLQWTQFTMLFDGFELLVHSRTRGVVMDIRNNNPVFGLDSLIQFKIIQAMHAAAPMTYPVAIYLLLREFPMKQTLMVVFYFVLLASTAFGYALRDKRGLDEVTGKSASNVGKQRREPEDDDTSAVQDGLRFAAMVGFRFAETLERNLVIALWLLGTETARIFHLPVTVFLAWCYWGVYDRWLDQPWPCKYFRDRHTPHLAIKHLVHFNNCQERTNWTLRKMRRLWHCFGRCVLVWFAYPGFDFMCPTWLQESRRAPGHVHMFARIIETALVCVALFVWPFRDTAERAFDLMWIWVTVGVGAARVALFIVLGMYASWIKFSHEERALELGLAKETEDGRVEGPIMFDATHKV